MQLLLHSESTAGPVREFDATAAYAPDGALQFSWRLVGDVSGLRLPPATAPAPGPADGLWRHTCLEAFVADPHSAGYLELNFSPSGQWAAYGFRGYRTGMTPLPLRKPPEADWQRSAGELALNVTFRMDDLPGPPGPRPPVPLRVALAAVLEHENGDFSWWALRHPSGKPDFHHADSFVLQIAPVSSDRPAP